VRYATIAAEDDSFYRHYGFDPFSIARALRKNLESGRITQGGSTITQQVARIFYLDSSRTIARKLNEIVIAFKIDRMYGKDDILDLYLNSIPYGSNAYGIQAAAETFFGKDASSLSVDEAAFIAALPKATTYYSPYRGREAELIARQRGIIRRMAELGFISVDEEKNALTTETFARVRPKRDHIVAPHFVFHVLDGIRNGYGEHFFEQGGLRIKTSLDVDMQEIAEGVIARGVAKNSVYGSENAALVTKDVRTGEILAMVGSRDYFDTAIDGEVNVALRPRQPGSAFKPFVYARAFEEGFEPESHILDAPVNFGPDGGGRDYIPQNYSGKSYGMLTMRQALSMSLNVPAVQTLKIVGVDDAIDLAERLGITTLTDRKRYGLSLVLGGAEVRLFDMVSAFSVFAADGTKREPISVLRIERDGDILHEVERKESNELEPEIARRIGSILSDNAARTPVFGPRSPLAYPAGGVAAKTGTTQGFRDAWTVGFTRSIAVGVWAGNNDNRPMRQGADGVFVAAPIWRDFMDRVLPEYPAEPFPAYAVKEGGGDKLIAGGELRAYADADDSEKKPEKKKGGKKKKTKKG
jgi:penicillin-binding protein 1C